MSFSVFSATQEWSQTGGLASFDFETLASTNDLAKEKAFQEADSLVLYFTREQTKGRGRGDHTWSSPPGDQAFLGSFSLQLLSAAQPIFAPIMGLALYKAAKGTWINQDWSLKAPNDLFLGTKKVAGLLIESVQMGGRHRLVVGLGLNVWGHPHIDRSGALSDFIPADELTAEIWRGFLDRFLLEMTSNLLLVENELPPIHRKALVQMLNAHPDQVDPLEDVSPLGDLTFRSGKKTPWMSL